MEYTLAYKVEEARIQIRKNKINQIFSQKRLKFMENQQTNPIQSNIESLIVRFKEIIPTFPISEEVKNLIESFKKASIEENTRNILHQQNLNSSLVPYFNNSCLENHFQIYKAIQWIFINLSQTQDHIYLQQLIDSGMLSICLESIKEQNLKIMEDAFWILSNMVFKEENITDFVLKRNILEVINKLLKEISKDLNIFNMYCTFITNIIHENLNIIYKKQILYSIIQLIQYICQFSDRQMIINYLIEILKPLQNLFIFNKDLEIFIQEAIDQSLYTIMVTILNQLGNFEFIRKPFLVILFQSLYGSSEQLNYIWSIDFEKIIKDSMKHQKEVIRDIAIQILANAVVDDINFLARIMNSSLVELMIQTSIFAEQGIKESTTSALSNILIYGEDWHFRKIIGWGFFNFTTNLLNDQENKDILVVQVLNLLSLSFQTAIKHNIEDVIKIELDKTNIIIKLENLVNSDYPNIALLSKKLLRQLKKE